MGRNTLYADGLRALSQLEGRIYHCDNIAVKAFLRADRFLSPHLVRVTKIDYQDFCHPRISEETVNVSDFLAVQQDGSYSRTTPKQTMLFKLFLKSSKKAKKAQ